MSDGNNFHFTFNFHGPVGQQIAHVDKLEAHFDKDMTMQVVDTAASPQPSPFLRLAQDKKGEGALSKNPLTIPT